MKSAGYWQRAACVAALAAGLGGLGACAAGEAVRPATEARVAPLEMVRKAGLALGPERARAAALALQADQAGSYFALEQARSPSQPIAEAGRAFRWRYDVPKGRLIREADQLFPGGILFSNRTALASDGGWDVDLLRWRRGTDLSQNRPEEALRARLQWERFFPHMLIHQASSAAAAEAAGPSKFRYRDGAGAEIEVTLDPATMRPIRAAEIVDGKAQSELVYSDYERRHGILLPTRLQIFQAGRLQEDLRLGRSAVQAPQEALFAVPSGYAAPPAAGKAQARELAPGTFFFDNMPGNYHSMAADVGDHFVLVEAPLSAAYAAEQKRLLAELRPGKPVRYVLVTHHHGDHTGGLAAWAEAGATIVVPQGAKVAIERQLRARGFTGDAKIQEVAERRSFGAGAGRVDAHVFSSSHSEVHLIAHLPGSGTLFQGDLFYVPERGEVPAAFPVVKELEAQIARLGLHVERIAGAHGRIGSIQDMRESLRRGPRH